MKITKFKNKYRIDFGSISLLTYEEVILDNELLYKKNFNYEEIKKCHEFYDGYYKVLKFVNLKMRSKKEVLDYINKNKLDLKIIDKLEKINLINDEKFCKSYISDKINLSKDGVNKIKRDLLKHNIDLNLINQQLESLDKDVLKDRLNKLILKKFQTNKYSNEVLKQKILIYLINLGYDKKDILECLKDYNKDDSSLYIKEYNKLYEKLRTKYSGKELEYKIKTRLYQKGFKKE